MPSLLFLPSEKVIQAPPGTLLLDAISKAGLKVVSPCGTTGTCGKCIVKILSGQLKTSHAGLLSDKAVKEGYVHACQSIVTEQDLTIEIPSQLQKREGGQFANIKEDFQRLDPACFPKKWELDSGIKIENLKVFSAQLEDGLSDFDRLKLEILEKTGTKEIECDLKILRLLAETLRISEGEISTVLYCEEEKTKILALNPGHDTLRSIGLAIDLGTTTVSVQAVDLTSAEILATETDYNLQITCGSDVISRINYARKPERLSELTKRATKTINLLISRLEKQLEISGQQIHLAVISGNTTMIHLLTGLAPEYIRLEPYTPTLLECPPFSARELGFHITPTAPLLISPAVGSYVGGDITSGLLCTDLAGDSEEISVFLDIGTNGELVIGNHEFLLTCACSAGPAFEGGGIADGMRAAKGAIESVKINPESGKPDLKIIGDDIPTGICGSGLISLIAELLETGWIDSAGKLNRERVCDHIFIDGKQAFYQLAVIEAEDSNKTISISEAEIENVIRAKAAIYAACTLMLNQLGLSFSEISKYYVAGGFGRFLNLEDCIKIGLLPDIDREKFEFIGNSSLVGSYFLLIAKSYREKQRCLQQKMTYIDLSSDPNYMDQYTAALFLPHTDHSQFPSVF